MFAYEKLRSKYHSGLAVAEVRNLGVIHWFLIEAADGVLEKSHADSHEVGHDEIYWWVYTREADLDELLEETKKAMSESQKLKEDADKLRYNAPNNYESLVKTLLDFAQQHAAQIETVLNYVRFLKARHDLAPSMLFAYRVWGATTRSDRWSTLAKMDLANNYDDSLQELGELVLGLMSGKRFPAVTRAEFEIGADKSEGAIEAGQDVKLTEQEIVTRAARDVYDECAEYFTKIRDSLRNIALEISKYKRLKNAIDDEGFWRRFILSVTKSGKTETEHWDFKELLTLWVAKGPGREREKVNFSESLAAFANNKGGVLIVGVTDQKKIVGVDVKLLEDRLKDTNDVLAAHLDYSRTLVTIKQVTVNVGGTDKLCLIVIAAQASEPVAVKDGDKFSYPIRRGTGLTRVDRRTLLLGNAGRVKSDNYDFLSVLEQFTKDNSV